MPCLWKPICVRTLLIRSTPDKTVATRNFFLQQPRPEEIDCVWRNTTARLRTLDTDCDERDVFWRVPLVHAQLERCRNDVFSQLVSPPHSSCHRSPLQDFAPHPLAPRLIVLHLRRKEKNAKPVTFKLNEDMTCSRWKKHCLTTHVVHNNTTVAPKDDNVALVTYFDDGTQRLCDGNILVRCVVSTASTSARKLTCLSPLAISSPAVPWYT